MQTKDGQHVAARLVPDRCASQREIWKVRTCFLILAFTWVAIFAFFSNLTIPPADPFRPFRFFPLYRGLGRTASFVGIW